MGMEGERTGLLWDLIFPWRYVSILCGLQGKAKKLYFVSHFTLTEQSLFIFTSLTLASSPSYNLSHATQSFRWLPFREFTKDFNLSLWKPWWLSTPHLLQLPSGPPDHFLRVKPRQHFTVWLGEADISSSASLPGHCLAISFPYAGTWLSMQHLFRDSSLGQHQTSSQQCVQASCSWYKWAVWSSSALSALSTSSVLFLFKERQSWLQAQICSWCLQLTEGKNTNQ